MTLSLCMFRPLEMALLLLSAHLLLNQHLLHPYLIHQTHLPGYLYICLRPQLVIVLIKGAVRGMPLCWFPW